MAHVEKPGLAQENSVVPLSTPDVTPELIHEFLTLQMRVLRLQLELFERQERERNARASTLREAKEAWNQIELPALIVLAAVLATAIIAFANWDYASSTVTIRGSTTLTATPTSALVTVAAHETTIAGTSAIVAAAGRAIAGWWEVIVWVVAVGSGVAIRGLAVRSLALVGAFTLSIIWMADIVFLLMLTDRRLVDPTIGWTQIDARGWVASAVGLIFSVAVLGLLARSTATITQRRASHSGRFRSSLSNLSTRWQLNKVWDKATMPKGLKGWLGAIGILTLLCGMLLSLVVAAVIVSLKMLPNNDNTNAFVGLLAVIAFSVSPIGPLWWALVVEVMRKSRQGSGRVHQAVSFVSRVLPITVAVSFWLFIFRESTALWEIVAGLGSLGVWLLWYIWTLISVPAWLRLVYMPALVGVVAILFLSHGALAFFTLSLIVSIGIPASKWWVSRRKALALSQVS